VRFKRNQAGLLDVLLASQPEISCDELFERVRSELRSFTGISAVDPPFGFQGQLRPYQREGLGWLHFLQKFGLGGCLADDMGLGKTIQVLSLLEERRVLRAETSSADRLPPSLVVMPRSLVFNWKKEAERFTPELRVLEHTGGVRIRGHKHFDDYDAVFTTYGTLRRDAPFFKDKLFDYVILDEAQAIKNASTESAKAARLLRGNHRLALSGTPIENHLGELWSLFEFLNPGMLGSATVFKLGKSSGSKPDEEIRALLAQALRPFILRRTKAQVARDLPAKVEQTLFCQMEPAQRALYNELRDHYRRALLNRIERDGLEKSKIHILEALLRLRQAAIHPGLIDRSRINEASAKMDMLMPQLSEVLEEGHKALIFSQFTSMLGILRARLDAEHIRYEYLDGQTYDRAAPVERFQNDPESKLFLISLKAGGLGLNLTAAEYVFILDPWWNPAVEAQAVDRTHRIGQTRSVFAYRLIAKDTVEEKVLELQQTKREIADAIINQDNSLIRDLRPEDLAVLLS
jgi:SNF2 family DNA or RNA helicase